MENGPGEGRDWCVCIVGANGLFYVRSLLFNDLGMALFKLTRHLSL